jgi:hypothetical protein
MLNQSSTIRWQLLQLVRRNFPGGSRMASVRRLQWLIQEVEDLKRNAKKVYNPKGQLVDNLFMGQIWVQQKTQRRRVDRIFPTRPKGRPRPVWARYLISKLGEEYLRQTGLVARRGKAGGSLSPFERFAKPILELFGIFDTQNIVREYCREKKKRNPWGGFSSIN